MNRLLILGAGASKKAGYPLANELLAELAREAEADENYKDTWGVWVQFLAELPEELALLGKTANPEIILSLIDLFGLALDCADEDRMKKAFCGALAENELAEHYDSKERQFVLKARKPKYRFLNALDYYFSFKHRHDQKPSREYLAALLDPLSAGDAVLTFNWDSLAERTLLEQGKWFPADGFGFPRTLVRWPCRESLAVDQYRPSDVLVLKLHGSFGWRLSGKRLFLDRRKYLADFTFELGGKVIQLCDAEEPLTYSPTFPLVAYPSFVKQLSHPAIEETWRVASALLSCAGVVEVVGYSLPPSDSAARALFLPLANRLQACATRVIVRDPSRSTLDRWVEFLGPRVECREEKWGSYCSASTEVASCDGSQRGLDLFNSMPGHH